ncbi:MAG: DUF3365 domain-containing protein [Sulfurovum sp.]|nr:DUF3365 domain-containing protein [Sulfurovum sp.]
MKRIFILGTTLCFSSLVWASSVHSSELSPRQEGTQAIKLLGKTLKSSLIEKMHLDATGTAAMTFCISQAQTLTAEVNTKLPSHVEVRRTSLQIRNMSNNPDETDIQVMQTFKKAVEEKKSSASMMREVKVGEVTRIYKPLLVGKACLKCHGENISPVLNTTLNAAYPEDNATGLTLGDFRGVIVAEVAKH